MSRLVGIGVVLAALSVARPAHAVKRYALVIGVDRPEKADLATLRYADDDAAQAYALFSSVPGDAVLLSVLDPETQRVFPELAAHAEVPTREHVLSRARALFSEMKQAQAQGEKVEFYFVFSGHGTLSDTGEGQLELTDAPLTRTDLYDQLLAASPADFNHLLIDACDAYYFVNSRGDAPTDAELRARAEDFLSRDTLARFPNTGALLSTSGAAASHEWSAIRAGVFSHLLRSALLGAGDVDGDGQVTYAEAEAFVASASAKVSNAEAQLRVFARAPPRDLQHPLFDDRDVSGGALRLSADEAGRMRIEDERGMRYADFNKSAEGELRVALLAGSKYFVRTAAGEYEVQPRGEVRLAGLSPQPPRAGSRGSVSDALDRDLFAVPFGPAFFEGWSAREMLAPSPSASLVGSSRPASGLRKAALGTGIAALVAAGVGAGFAVAANSSYGDYQAATTPDALNHAADATRVREDVANVAFGAAAALGIAATTLFVVDLVER